MLVNMSSFAVQKTLDLGIFLSSQGLFCTKAQNYDRRFWKAEDKEFEFHAYPVYFLVLSMSFNDSKFVD
jgi:hypothetical protein